MGEHVLAALEGRLCVEVIAVDLFVSRCLRFGCQEQSPFLLLFRAGLGFQCCDFVFMAGISGGVVVRGSASHPARCLAHDQDT